MRDIGTALVWAALMPLSLWSAHIGVLVWIWTALMVPNDMVYGFMSSVAFNKQAAAVTILALVLGRDWKGFYLDTTLAILLLLAATATVSAAMAIGPEPSLFPGNGHLYERFFKVLALAFIVAGVMDSRWRLHAVVVTICIAFGFNMVTDGAKFLLTAGGHRVAGKSSVGDNNHLALAFLMTLPLILYAMRQSAARVTKLAFGALLAMGAVGVVGTYSRGGFIGLLVLALCLVAASRRKVAGLLLMAAAVGVFYLTAPESYFARVDTINAAEQDESFMTRVISWKVSTLIALDRPLVGGGFWAVQRPDVWAEYVKDIDRLDFIPTPPPTHSYAAHSIYFEMLGDQGFVGLGVFLLLLGHCLFRCRQIKRAARGDPSKAWAGDLAAMLQLSLIVYCVSGALVSMARFEAFYVLVAVLSRLNRIERVEAGAPAASPAASPARAPARRRPQAPGAAAPPPALAGQGWRGRAAAPLPRSS